MAADKAYDIRAWVAAVRRMRITPHVAQNAFGYGGSAIDARTTRHAGYRVSHRKRKLIEQAFGWLKTVATNLSINHIQRYKKRWRFFSDLVHKDDEGSEKEVEFAAPDTFFSGVDTSERREWVEREADRSVAVGRYRDLLRELAPS